MVVWWMRIRLPMQGTRVQSLVQEYSTCRGAAKPMHHDWSLPALEPMPHKGSHQNEEPAHNQE